MPVTRTFYSSRSTSSSSIVSSGGKGTDFFEYVGKVLQEDVYQQAVDKIKSALKRRGNWTRGRPGTAASRYPFIQAGGSRQGP